MPSERHAGEERHGFRPFPEQVRRDRATGIGEGAAGVGEQHRAAGGVERRPVDVVPGDLVLEAAGVAQHLQAEAVDEGPEVLGEALCAHPAGIVGGEFGGEAGEEPGIERGVVRDEHGGLEVAHGRPEGVEGLGQAGLARDVLRHQVMHGGGGRGDVAFRVDQAGEERPAGVGPAGGGVDAEADGGEFDDGVPGGVEAGGFDIDGESMKGWHGRSLGCKAWGRRGAAPGRRARPRGRVRARQG